MATSRPPPTAADFFHASKLLFQRAKQFGSLDGETKFRALFGVTPSVCSIVWSQIQDQIPRGGKTKHLLWALLFLKVYATGAVNSALTGVSSRTFRKWSWKFVRLISRMGLISWSDRKFGRSFNGCRVSVDGTDSRIEEPYPLSPIWFSHKFKGPGLRYEVGISISTGHLVWVNGPFPCGSFSDLKIFQQDMKKMLDAEESVIADGGYRDPSCKKLGTTPGATAFYAAVRARHETGNRRLKHFNAVGTRFRHRISLHSFCFHAVANFTQLMLQTTDPLFEIEQ